MPRLLIVQTGDFLEAVSRLDAGAPEHFHDQNRSVAFVRDLARDWEVHVAANAQEAYDETLAPGLTVSGWPGGTWQPDLGRELIARHAPDAVLPRLPNAGLIDAAGRRGIPCFPCLADVFRPFPTTRMPRRQDLRDLRDARRMRAALAHPSVVGCGNHGRAATGSLHEVLGLALEACLPWEWSALPIAARRRALRPDRDPVIVFAGRLVAAKGVLDLVAAVGHLARRGVAARLVVAGDGPDRGAVADLVSREGLGDRVELPGHVAKETVRGLMRDADILAAPSWRAYAEGLPNTLVEGLAFGKPVLLTDHPATSAYVRDGETALTVPERTPEAIAAALARAIETPDLYARLVDNSASAYRGLFVGASWYDVVTAFLGDPTDATGWVRAHSLASLTRLPDGREVVAARAGGPEKTG